MPEHFHVGSPAAQPSRCCSPLTYCSNESELARQFGSDFDAFDPRQQQEDDVYDWFCASPQAKPRAKNEPALALGFTGAQHFGIATPATSASDAEETDASCESSESGSSESGASAGESFEQHQDSIVFVNTGVQILKARTGRSSAHRKPEIPDTIQSDPAASELSCFADLVADLLLLCLAVNVLVGICGLGFAVLFLGSVLEDIVRPFSPRGRRVRDRRNSRRGAWRARSGTHLKSIPYQHQHRCQFRAMKAAGLHLSKSKIVRAHSARRR